MDTKVRGRDALLAHLREVKCSISVTYRGGRRSGYLRHSCEHRVWPGPAVEALRREKLIESFIPDGMKSYQVEFRPFRLKAAAPPTKETDVKHDDTTKRIAGTVCILHGTFTGMTKCPICDGYRATGGEPGCECCGAKLKPMRRFAFTPATHNDRALPGGGGIIIGRADEGTRGYSPLLELGTFETFEAGQTKADELNVRAGLEKRAAALIVVSTMHVRESEIGRVLKAGLRLIDRVALGTADQDELDEWKEEARRYAHD